MRIVAAAWRNELEFDLGSKEVRVFNVFGQMIASSSDGGAPYLWAVLAHSLHQALHDTCVDLHATRTADSQPTPDIGLGGSSLSTTR